MIGVSCYEHERPFVEEFFELFKTPWEYRRPGREYQLILNTGFEIDAGSLKPVLLYNGEVTELDQRCRMSGGQAVDKSFLFSGQALPIYGKLLEFNAAGGLPADIEMLNQSAYRTRINNIEVIRIGYDLFREVDILLRTGQPTGKSLIPSLELHIHLLRNLILSQGIPVIEIPPFPPGHNSITCLTHDVDFLEITPHFFDRTIMGFIYRAVIGSIPRALRERRGLIRLLRNWVAVLSLPAVFLGLCRDFFNNISKYLEIEKDLSSTFFLIPFKNRDGVGPGNLSAINRSVKYDIGDLAEELEAMSAAGCEIGLHGIDAWRSSGEAVTERERLAAFTGNQAPGIRMHWLFFDKESPAVLAQAGFLYDSTMGYNDAVGFKCGTAQVFRFPEMVKLSELPLIIQDTALFYADRMNLKEGDAEELVMEILGIVETYGGVITINWHQRSIGPERLWGDFYVRILDALKQRGSWFVRAEDAVRWFDKRRSVRFGKIDIPGGSVEIEFGPAKKDSLPGINLRIIRPASATGTNILTRIQDFESVDMVLNETANTRIPL